MNRKQLVLKLFSALLAVMLLVANKTTVQAQEQASEKSLYERLGGVYSIATVVDDLIERLLVNDILNANPAINEARHRVPKAGLKFSSDRNGLSGHRWPGEIQWPHDER